MIGSFATRQVSIRLFHLLFIAIVASGAFVLGMVARPWDSSAAPASTIEACVSRYTGGVRMSPYGTITCNSNETKVVWPATQGATNYEIRGSVYNVPPGESTIRTLTCEAGEIAVGGGGSVAGAGMILTSDLPVNSNNAVEGLPTARNIGARNTDQVNFGSLFAAIICASTTP